MSLPTCKSCGAIETEIRAIHEADQRYDRPAVTVEQIAPDPDDGLKPGLRYIDSKFHQNDAGLLDASNAVVHTIPADDLIFIFTISYLDGRSMVNEIQTP